jgi:hypothetical protein
MNQIFAHVDSVSYAPDVNISWLAIVLATLAAMVIGWVWYGPIYGKQWMNLAGLKKKDLEKDSWRPIYITVVLSILQAFILSHFVIYASYFYPDINSVVMGLITGFWAWVGFSLITTATNVMFYRRSNEEIKIGAGNTLVTLLVMGAIIGAFV